MYKYNNFILYMFLQYNLTLLQLPPDSVKTAVPIVPIVPAELIFAHISLIRKIISLIRFRISLSCARISLSRCHNYTKGTVLFV